MGWARSPPCLKLSNPKPCRPPAPVCASHPCPLQALSKYLPSTYMPRHSEQDRQGPCPLRAHGLGEEQGARMSPLRQMAKRVS